MRNHLRSTVIILPITGFHIQLTWQEKACSKKHSAPSMVFLEEQISPRSQKKLLTTEEAVTSLQLTLPGHTHLIIMFLHPRIWVMASIHQRPNTFLPFLSTEAR